MNNKLKIFAVLSFLIVGFIGSVSAWSQLETFSWSGTGSPENNGFTVNYQQNRIFAGGYDDILVTDLDLDDNNYNESSAPFGLATGQFFTDDSGNSYVLEARDSTNAYEINPDGSRTSVGSTNGKVPEKDEHGEWDPVNDVYVYTDPGSDTVNKFNPSTGSSTQLKSVNDGSFGIEVKNGYAYIDRNNQLEKIDVSNGNVVDTWSWATPNGDGIRRIDGVGYASSKGHLFVSYQEKQTNNEYIRVFDENDVSKTYYTSNNGDSPMAIEYSNNDQFVSYGFNSMTVRDTTASYSSVYSISGARDYVYSPNDDFLYTGEDFNGLKKHNVTGIIKPPSASINSPSNNYDAVGNDSGASVSYDFTVDTEGTTTTYDVVVNGTTIDSGTLQAGSQPKTVSGSVKKDVGEYPIYLTASSAGGSTTTNINKFYIHETSFEYPVNSQKVAEGESEEFKFNFETSRSGTLEAKIKEPDGNILNAFSTTQNSNKNKTYTFSETLTKTGINEWYTTINSANRDYNNEKFDVISYNKPNYTLKYPTKEKFLSYSDTTSRKFNFTIDSQASGTYKIQLKNSSGSKWTNASSGSFSSGTNDIKKNAVISMPSEGNLLNKEWRIYANDGFSESYSTTKSFKVEHLVEPSVSIERPKNNEVFYIEEGSTVEIPFEGWVNNSEETGIAYAHTLYDDPDNFLDDIGYNEKLGDIAIGTNQFFSGDVTVATNGSHKKTRIEARLDTGNKFTSSERTFEVKVANPQITDFNADPDFENIKVGEYFDVNVEGDIVNASIQKIKYDLDVGQSDAKSFTKKPIDFQDQNQFTDSVNNAFQMKEAWRGKEITISATVYDANGLTDSESEDGTTTTPPDGYNLNKPNPGQVVLISEGDSDAEVSYEYGVNSAENSGTSKLIVNGAKKDSFSISADSSQTTSYTENLTEGDYNWFVRWEDSSSGLTYDSEQLSFDVTDEPISLNLNNPNNGENINLLDKNETSVDHKFNVDSRAHTGNYYYKFVLEDTTNNNVIRNTTSQDFSSGTRDHTEVLNTLENASYSWNVKIFDSSTDKLLENSSSSYTIVKEPLFDLSLDRPSDGAIYQVEPGNNANVLSEYSTTTYADSVDLDLTLNGSNIDSQTVSKDTSETFRYNITGLSPNTYNLKVLGEDEDGRTDSRSVSFDVREVENESSEDAEPKVTNAYFEPSIEEASVGDEVDLILEGTKTPEDVDFIDVQVETGAGTETFVVPSSDLKETNSFVTTVATLTVTSAMISEDVDVSGAVTSVTGAITDFFFNIGQAGSDASLGAVLNYPVNDQPVKQPPGVSEDVRFNFNINTLQEEADYSVLVDGNESSTPGTFGLVASSEGNSNLDPIPPESNEEIQVFRNMDSELFVNQSRGDFRWKVKVFTGDGSDSDDSVTYSKTEEFRILNSSVSTLNFRYPGQGDELVTESGVTNRPVNFQFEADVNESGTLFLELKGDSPDANYETIYDENIGSGKKPDSEEETLEEGSYTAKLNFESDNIDIQKTTDFAVVPTDTSSECESAEIEFTKPEYETLYKDSEYLFEWRSCNPEPYPDSNATLYIEDDDGNVVRSVKKNYDSQTEFERFSDRYVVDQPVGEYTAYANLTYNNTEIKSNERSYEVVDFTKPESENLIPDGANFNEDEDIELQWETQSYEENVEVEAKVKPKGEYKASTVFSEDQSASSLQEYSDTITREAGEYEWFIEMTVSPSGSPEDMTFTSNKSTFLVESKDIQKADFRLDTPPQDEVYEIPNSSDTATVPFAFESRVYSRLDSDIELKLEKVVEGEGSGYKRVRKWTQKGEEGFVPRNISRGLEEAGYRYRVTATDPNGKVSYSANRSFAVNDLETEETPEVPTPEEEPGGVEKFVASVTAGIGILASAIGTAGLFIIATFFTIVAGLISHQMADGSDSVALVTFLLTAFAFVYIGWLPGWLGFILFMASAGIFMWIVRKATVGGE